MTLTLFWFRRGGGLSCECCVARPGPRTKLNLLLSLDGAPLHLVAAGNLFPARTADLIDDWAACRIRRAVTLEIAPRGSCCRHVAESPRR